MYTCPISGVCAAPTDVTVSRFRSDVVNGGQSGTEAFFYHFQVDVVGDSNDDNVMVLSKAGASELYNRCFGDGTESMALIVERNSDGGTRV
jgi:hypothetical protein